MAETVKADQWQLADLYQSMTDPAIQSDLETIDQEISQLQEQRGQLGSLSPEKLLAVIELWEGITTKLYRIDLYTDLLEATQIGDPAVTRFKKKTQEALVARSTQLIFLDTELAQLPEERWQSFLTAPELKPYRFFLEQLHKTSQHTLTEPEEKILAEKEQTGHQALLHLFELTTTSLTFPWKKQSLTLEELLDKFRDPDAAVRKQAAKTLHEGLNSLKLTTPSLLNSLIHDKAVNDRLRQFAYPEAARFIADGVEPAEVKALQTAVHQSASQLITRYYQIKKELLGVDKLYWWDRYAPLPGTSATIEQDEAKAMVLEAYQRFSPRMAEIAQAMFDKAHVDWLPSQTKRGGAFCAFGGKTSYPYVLLNYTKSPRDVMTLAHELGHAIHDVLAEENNRFFQTHPSLALAEIASVFGETLLFEELLQSDLKEQDKIALLMAFIEDRFATVFRQITIFDFEQALHEARRTKGELAKDEIDELWDEATKKPFAEALEYTDEHKNSWMYVSHIFHWPFYVYSYSYAQLCVLALYQQYKKQGSGFAEIYLQLLRSGGSQTPKATLKAAGLDITDVRFWQSGLSVLEDLISDLEKLAVSQSDHKL